MMQQKPKYTHGPWEVRELTIVPTACSHRPVAEVDCCPMWFKEGNEICKANANLIASAPKLLELLDAFVYKVECNGDLWRDDRCAYCYSDSPNNNNTDSYEDCHNSACVYRQAKDLVNKLEGRI
jgi:hypothetical protein